MSRTLRSPVPQSAVQRIQALILSGELARATRLPPERQLAAQLAVSRASLREALSILETMGLVRTKPGRGTFVVVEDGINGTVAPLPVWRFASRYTLREVYQLRYLTEGYAARLAAMAATDEEVAALQKILQNRILTDLHDNYRTVFLESQRLPMARHERIWEPADEHEKLVQAIARRDPNGAEYYMRLHITRAADRVNIALSDTPPAS